MFLLFFPLSCRGTINTAVLKVIVNMNNLVDFSVYDTKPLRFISLCCVTILWNTKKRSMFNPVAGSMRDMQILILNINDEYNKNMKIVDISDQVRNKYRIGSTTRYTNTGGG